jgi:hypothetical protein
MSKLGVMSNLECDIPIFTDLFSYEDGQLYRKVKMGNAFPIGSLAGSIDPTTGYVRTKILGKSWSVHRIVFYMHHGYLPEFIDHIDRNRANNKIENLRPCTKSQNVVNSKVRTDNPYRYKGVTFHKASGKYASQSFIHGKRVHIGLFKTPEEAAIAYNEKAKELFGDFAVLNEINIGTTVYEL